MALIKGDQVVLTIDAVDYTANAKSVVIDGEENTDATTFAGRAYDYTMTISGLQDDEDGSLYDIFWSERGEIVPFTVKSTTTGRQLSGEVRMPDKIPTWGGDAFSTWTFDGELEVIGEPTRAAVTP